MNVITLLSLRGSLYLSAIMGVVVCVAIILCYVGFRLITRERWVKLMAASAVFMGLEAGTQVLVWRHDLWDQTFANPLWLGLILFLLHLSKPTASLLMLLTASYLLGIDNPWRLGRKVFFAGSLGALVLVSEYFESFAWHAVPGVALRLWAMGAFLYAAYKNLAPFKRGHAAAVVCCMGFCAVGLLFDGLSPVWAPWVGSWQGLLKTRNATGAMYFFSHETAIQMVSKTVFGLASLLVFGAGSLLVHCNLMLFLPRDTVHQRNPFTDLRGTVGSVRETTKAETVVLWARDPGMPGETGQGRVVIDVAGQEHPYALRQGSAMHEVVMHARMKANRNARGTSAFSNESFGSFLSLPIHSDGEVVGCLYLEWSKAYAFTATTLVYLEKIIDHLVPVLQNKRQILAFERVATDLNRLEGNQAHKVGKQVVAILSEHVAPRGVGLYLQSGKDGKHYWEPSYCRGIGGGVAPWDAESIKNAVVIEHVAASEQGGESLAAMAFVKEQAALVGHAMFRQALVSMVAKMIERVAMRHIEERLLAHDRPALLMHEVKNQMAIVDAGLFNLEDDIAFKAYDKMQSRLLVIKDAARSIASLASGFLPSPSVRYSKEQVSVRDVVDSVVSRYDLFLKSRKIDVQLAGEMNVTVKIPYDSFVVALQNLIVNAVDAIQEKSRLSVICSMHDIWVHLMVSNDGEINKEILPHLFDEGYTTKKSGSGMGLYLCLRTLRRSNGDILVASENGKTTFTLKMQRENYHG